MSRRIASLSFSILALLLVSVVAACGSTGAPSAPNKGAAPAQAQKTAEPPALAALPAGPEKDRVQGLIDMAKQEGQVAWRATLVKDETAKALVDAFKTYYGLPADFKVNYDTDMIAADLTNKTNAEIGAGKLAVDIVSTGTMAWMYDLLGKGEIMKYDSPIFKAYTPALEAGIAEPGYWAADAYTFVPTWNTQLVPKGIKTWEDELDPSFKDKMSMIPLPTSDTAAAHYMALKSVLGQSYWEGIAKQRPLLVSRADDIVAKAISGERPLGQASMPSRVYQQVQKGAPVDLVFPAKGSLLTPQPWAILAKAAHPNAAKLWIDFIFSEQGQEVYQKGEALVSGRAGFVPPSEVAKYAPPLDKIKAIPFNWKELTPEKLAAAKAEIKAILDAAK